MVLSRLVVGHTNIISADCNKTNQDVEELTNHELNVSDMWRDIQVSNNWNGMLNPINPFLKVEILRYGDFAHQFYDSFDSTPSSTYYGNYMRGKSNLGQQMELLKCGHGYEVTKYIYANTYLLDSIFSEESKEGLAWMGYIAVFSDPVEIKRLGRRDIVVAWRGTQTAFEWMQNLRDILVPLLTSKVSTCSNIQTISNPDVRIEKGFLSCYTSTDKDSVRCMLSTREIVTGEITRLVKQYKEQGEEEFSITFTGHSLGAALATLSAYDIKETMENKYSWSSINVTVFSFTSPCIGNLSFAHHLEEIDVKVLLVANHRDLVPKIPGFIFNEKMGCLTRLLRWLTWASIHVGVEISLFSNRLPFLKWMHNPANFHNLEVYLHAIDGFQGNHKLPLKPSGRDLALVNKHSDLLIESLQIPRKWWAKRNKEVVRRIDGTLVYSPTTPTPVPLP